ncbi:peptide chain release factor N(5)-glutamine methyltransferase [soil metagenome]
MSGDGGAETRASGDGANPRSSVASLLAEARAAGVDRLDAQLLLVRDLACSRTWLLAHDDALLDAAQTATLRTQLARRAAGEPLAYLVGEKEFHGLLLSVDPRVLVPRPDTEVLVDWALELLTGDLRGEARPRVIDLGTGSGAIALAVKHGHAAAQMTATDASPGALEVARGNAARLGLDVAFAAGSWWQAAGAQRFHLALSNPPYIAAGDSHLPALAHEPTLALTPGGNGLGALAAIVQGTAQHLEPRGWLLLEHGFDQAEAVQAMLLERGFTEVETRRDLGGQPRCTGGRL